MGEPSTSTAIDDAVALLNTDPLLRAARDITVAAMRRDFESDPKVRAAAALIVASRAPAQTTYTPDEARDLVRRATAATATLRVATEAVRYTTGEAERPDLDADARAAAQGALNEACRRLAGMVPRG